MTVCSQSDLVEFYYLWKKFQDSLMVLPQSKLKRQAALKRNTKTTTPTTENGKKSELEPKFANSATLNCIAKYVNS